jgi:hypothetical protein
MIDKIVFKEKKDYPSGIISNQIVGILDFGFKVYNNEITIDNCIINTLILHNARFEAGFCMRNCIVKNKVQYEMGGHNQKPVIFDNNIFESLFVFLDCIFEADLIITNNIFIDGCTLYNGYNEFNNVIIENNIGKMDDERWD